MFLLFSLEENRFAKLTLIAKFGIIVDSVEDNYLIINDYIAQI